MDSSCADQTEDKNGSTLMIWACLSLLGGRTFLQQLFSEQSELELSQHNKFKNTYAAMFKMLHNML